MNAPSIGTKVQVAVEDRPGVWRDGRVTSRPSRWTVGVLFEDGGEEYVAVMDLRGFDPDEARS